MENNSTVTDKTYITSTCLFGANKNLYIDYNDKKYKLTCPEDIRELTNYKKNNEKIIKDNQEKIKKLEELKQNIYIFKENYSHIINSETSLDIAEASLNENKKIIKVLGTEIGNKENVVENKGVVNNLKNENKLLQSFLDNDLMYLEVNYENKLNCEINNLNLSNTQIKTLLENKTAVLVLKEQQLSEYEYGLQLARFANLKQSGATSVKTNINDYQYNLYLKDVANHYNLTTEKNKDRNIEPQEKTKLALTEWQNYVNQRCKFLEESERKLANSLAMRHETIHAMQLREDKKISDDIFTQEILLDKKADHKKLVNLLIAEESTNKYKDFYKFKSEDFKNFHDISNRSWLAKNTDKNKETCVVLENGEKIQKEKFEILKNNDAFKECKKVEFSFVTPYTTAKTNQDKVDNKIKDVYYAKELLNNEMKEEIDAEIPADFYANNSKFRDFVKSRAEDPESSYLGMAKKNGINI